MRLFEHSDFEAVVTAAAAAAELEESFVEKDYYITEILRIVAERYGSGEVIFKGGTSLSKAWGLIQRLSEDVDLLFIRRNDNLHWPRDDGLNWPHPTSVVA